MSKRLQRYQNNEIGKSLTIDLLLDHHHQQSCNGLMSRAIAQNLPNRRQHEQPPTWISSSSSSSPSSFFFSLIIIAIIIIIFSHPHHYLCLHHHQQGYILLGAMRLVLKTWIRTLSWPLYKSGSLILIFLSKLI